MWLPPGQTRNAVVVCYIPPNIDIGIKDKITFTSQGLNVASQSAILTVTSPLSAGLVRYIQIIAGFFLNNNTNQNYFINKIFYAFLL